MIINIKRKGLNDKEFEQLKFELILHNEYAVKFGYNWNLKGEYKDESLEDFHLFCISIVKDLLEKKFTTNEEGKYLYENMEDFDNEAILEELEELFMIIAEKKLKKS